VSGKRVFLSSWPMFAGFCSQARVKAGILGEARGDPPYALPGEDHGGHY
jgi:hypothetical protein